MTLPKKKNTESADMTAQAVEKTMLVGVMAVAERLKCSMRTVSRYKFEFADFPVETEPKTGIWKAAAEDIDEWRRKHLDLFVSRKERISQREEEPLFKPLPRKW